jgi:hypothetical protein
MSTFRNPVGPQPSGVYWRRRLVVGLGLLAVIVIIVLIFVRPDSGTPQTTPSKSSTATPSPTSTNAVDECDPSKITVDAITDNTSYEAGVNPVLSFTLKSSATGPCTFAAGSDVQEFRVTSGDELIWTSVDCQVDPVAAVTTLQPGVPKQGPSLTWDRTRSSIDTCDAAREQVTSGGASYHFEMIVGDVKSATTKQFLLF